jgi:hypothetical protein
LHNCEALPDADGRAEEFKDLEQAGNAAVPEGGCRFDVNE